MTEDRAIYQLGDFTGVEIARFIQSGLNLPPITSGDAGKFIIVKADGTAFDLSTLTETAVSAAVAKTIIYPYVTVDDIGKILRVSADGLEFELGEVLSPVNSFVLYGVAIENTEEEADYPPDHTAPTGWAWCTAADGTAAARMSAPEENEYYYYMKKT